MQYFLKRPRYENLAEAEEAIQRSSIAEVEGNT